MFLTNEDRAAIKATYDFWGANKKTPQQLRNKLVESFLAEWSTKINVMKPIMMHPDTRRKDYSRSRCIADIMADFILSIDQVDERNQEYPIENAEKAFRENVKRRQYERSIVFQDEIDREAEDYQTPSYSIEEYAFNARNPIEETFFKEDNAETVEELRDLLTHVKKYRPFYVTTYSTEIPEKGRKPEKVDRAIRKLDITKVKECEICGGSYYAHYRGRIHCDAQKYPERNQSACEIKAHRKRNSAQKYSIM